ncbi:MAG TPA: TaqI-like C-terminal specificity domain-containing protein [Bacteroidales bacterium]|nr:TaqI-like C-terminal specificity domain-containing protein [Bacteroidales bacterium]
MQTKLSDTKEANGLTIKKAAQIVQVSTVTIRNWVKTGYLSQTEKNLISRESLDNFLLTVAGKDKLNSRANKRLKDNHNHQELTEKIQSLVQKFSGENIGIEYEKLLSNSYRNKEGIYYTPIRVIKDMFSEISFKKDLKFLDPSCGSGNFIIEAIKSGISPENVYGYDVDENAVIITRERIKKEFGIETANIKVENFLQEVIKLEKENMYFDLIFTNPPWGKKFDKSDKEKFAEIYGCGKSIDTTSLFMGACFSILKQNGILGFLMQEAFFNITTFEDIRKQAVKKQIIRFVDYGKTFKGLITKARAIILKNSQPNPKTPIKCCTDNITYNRTLESFKNNPKTIFNFWIKDSESKIIDHLYSVNHITLQNKANWALGIVTGNNHKYCINTQKEGHIPIYKGSDITKAGLKQPSTYISKDFSKFQQVAPLEMYQSAEKLIYKFISSDLCFFYDNQQRYILNSANLLIPVDIDISAKQLTSLLNSEIMNWLFKKLFSTHKVLRSDLELLPIYKDYFLFDKDFTETKFLEYLQIRKTEKGSYEITG